MNPESDGSSPITVLNTQPFGGTNGFLLTGLVFRFENASNNAAQITTMTSDTFQVFIIVFVCYEVRMRDGVGFHKKTGRKGVRNKN